MEEAFCPNEIKLKFNEIAILSAIKTAHIMKVSIRKELEAIFHDTGVLLVKHSAEYGNSQSITMHFEQFKKLQHEIENLKEKYVIRLDEDSFIEVNCSMLKKWFWKFFEYISL